MAVNMEDEELVKMFNPILKRRETILFFLIVVFNPTLIARCVISIIIVVPPTILRRFITWSLH